MAVAILALLTSLMAFWMLLVRDRARIAIFNLSNAANVLFNRPSNIYQHGMNERFANVLLLLSCTATVLTFTAGGWQYGASTGIVQILNERSFSEFTVHSGGQANRQVWVGAGFAALATLLIALMSRLERWRRYGYVDHIARGGNALPAHNPTHRWSKFEKWAWGWLGHKD